MQSLLGTSLVVNAQTVMLAYIDIQYMRFNSVAFFLNLDLCRILSTPSCSALSLTAAHWDWDLHSCRVQTAGLNYNDSW